MFGCSNILLDIWRFLGNWNYFGQFPSFSPSSSFLFLCSAKYCLALPAPSHHGVKKEIIFPSLAMAFSFLSLWQTPFQCYSKPSLLTFFSDFFSGLSPLCWKVSSASHLSYDQTLSWCKYPFLTWICFTYVFSYIYPCCPLHLGAIMV